MTAATRECPRCHRPAYEGLFCQFDGVFLLDELRSQNLITEAE